ncbi:MAG: saccharopine dehydrogenase NADP-binding domain-containing protein [Nannocystaceae bacterium]
MHKVLIIGAGGVGGVVAHKCAMHPQAFGEIVLASRTKARCDAIAAQIEQLHGRTITTAAVDTDDVAQTVALIHKHQPELLINVALPYQDLTLMEACTCRPASTTSTPPTTSRRTWRSSNTSGSGPFASASRRPDAWRCWARASTPA